MYTTTKDIDAAALIQKYNSFAIPEDGKEKFDYYVDAWAHWLGARADKELNTDMIKQAMDLANLSYTGKYGAPASFVKYEVAKEGKTSPILNYLIGGAGGFLISKLLKI